MTEKNEKSFRGERSTSAYKCEHCGYEVVVDSVFRVHEKEELTSLRTEAECINCGRMMIEHLVSYSVGV